MTNVNNHSSVSPIEGSVVANSAIVPCADGPDTTIVNTEMEMAAAEEDLGEPATKIQKTED